jgi:hypothetical protein
MLRQRRVADQDCDLFLVQLAAAFHDAARQDEGVDRWESESEVLFRRWCKRRSCDGAAATSGVAKMLMHDADTLEILRVLPSPRHFDFTRLEIAREALIARADIDQLVHEVAQFIRITECAESKLALEGSGALYFMLMHRVVQMDSAGVPLPLLHDLLHELAGQ